MENHEGETVEQSCGRQARRLRTDRGWTQAEVAAEMSRQGASMTQTMVAKLEAATRPIRLNEVEVLARVFGVPMSAVLGRDMPSWLPTTGQMERRRARLVQQLLKATREANDLRMRAHVAQVSANEARERLDILKSELGELDRKIQMTSDAEGVAALTEAAEAGLAEVEERERSKMHAYMDWRDRLRERDAGDDG